MENIQIDDWVILTMEQLLKLKELAEYWNKNDFIEGICNKKIIGVNHSGSILCMYCPVDKLIVRSEWIEDRTLCAFIRHFEERGLPRPITSGDIIELVEYEIDKRKEHDKKLIKDIVRQEL